MSNQPYSVGQRVKRRVEGITPAVFHFYKVEEVYAPGQRPANGIASDLFYSVGDWTYIVSRVNSYGHTSRYYFGEGMIQAVEPGEGGMTRGEALAEAQRRWGLAGSVFDRIDEALKDASESYKNMTAESIEKNGRYLVGTSRALTDRRQFGNGHTWEECFAAVDAKNAGSEE